MTGSGESERTEEETPITRVQAIDVHAHYGDCVIARNEPLTNELSTAKRRGSRPPRPPGADRVDGRLAAVGSVFRGGRRTRWPAIARRPNWSPNVRACCSG